MHNFLKNFQILTDDEIEKLNQIAKSRTLKKNDYFVTEGQICQEFGFIINGALRSFYVSDEGVEITYCINFPSNLTAAYSSFITGQKTAENIQAITDVDMLVFSKSKFDELAKTHPNFINFQKIIAEQQYIELEKRIIQLQKNDATERYKNLIMNQPEYVNQIPLQYLASYLNISQRHLSRIRRDIAF